MLITLNNRFIVEKYTKTEIKAKIHNGFAQMSHKASLCPLKVLVDTSVNGRMIPAGSTAYVKEETLFLKTGAGANGDPAIPTYTNSSVTDKEFHILESDKIELVDIKE